MWEAINNAFAPCAFNFTAQVDPKDQVAKRGMPVPTDRIDQQGDVWKPFGPRGGGKWVVGRSKDVTGIRQTGIAPPISR